MKRKIFTWCIIVVFLLAASVVVFCERMHDGIASGIVRLHIIANSDKECDQKIKLLVKDAIVSSQKEIFKDGIKKTLNKEEKEKIKELALKILKEQGVSYGASVETGKFYFPTKKYENITLPAGEYDAVRVVLGTGDGQNWWCVMYPPLCFNSSAIGKADEESLNILKESMTEFEYGIVTEESIKIVPAFKLVEIWQTVKEKIR